MKLNQFAVYRVDQQTAGKALWHLPYQEARAECVDYCRKLPINLDS